MSSDSNTDLDVSVAMATYNGAQYLRPQLDSILNQTLVPKEIIIVDDASSDQTLSILEDYSKDYPEIIKIFKNAQNMGVCKSFERAIELCSQEYISLSDQDDVWFPNKLEILANYAKKNFSPSTPSLVFSDSLLTDRYLSPLGRTHLESLMLKPFSRKNQLLTENYIAGASCLFNTELKTISKNWPNNIIIHDWWLAQNAYYFGNIHFVDQILYNYRQHENNLIGDVSKTFSSYIRNLRKKLFVHRKKRDHTQAFLERHKDHQRIKSLIPPSSVFKRFRWYQKNEVLPQNSLKALVFLILDIVYPLFKK